MSRENSISPLGIAMVAQILGSLPVVLALALHPGLAEAPLGLALIQGGCAAIVSRMRQAPVWWIPIHLAFVPMLVAASRLALAPGWWLAGFAILLLVFWRTDRSRVPLYLSNRTTAEAVADLIPPAGGQILDLGCGDGGLLAVLARRRPDCSFLGLEHAPLPWLVARWRTRDLDNVVIRYGDFWLLDFGPYVLVYAFLSPAPMGRLWEKAVAEMGPGALLVSNSFPVPDVPQAAICRLSDPRQTKLFVYRPGT